MPFTTTKIVEITEAFVLYHRPNLSDARDVDKNPPSQGFIDSDQRLDPKKLANIVFCVLNFKNSAIL